MLPTVMARLLAHNSLFDKVGKWRNHVQAVCLFGRIYVVVGEGGGGKDERLLAAEAPGATSWGYATGISQLEANWLTGLTGPSIRLVVCEYGAFWMSIIRIQIWESIAIASSEAVRALDRLHWHKALDLPLHPANVCLFRKKSL